tara:strand:+ start:515 stop:706 length:192 start_codon:yes stop_codon:yes gene_type:complete
MRAYKGKTLNTLRSELSITKYDEDYLIRLIYTLFEAVEELEIELGEREPCPYESELTPEDQAR